MPTYIDPPESTDLMKTSAATQSDLDIRPFPPH